MDDLTTQDILEKLGLKSARTLRRWRELGLIPSPLVKPHPDGRGRIATWPATVLDRCLEIREKLREGRTLEEIAATVGKRKYRFQDDWDARERQLELFRLRETATKSLRKFARNCLERLDHTIITKEDFAEALKLAANGQEPMLVVTESDSTVVPRSGLTEGIARLPAGCLLAIIPINQLLRDSSTDSLTADESETGE